MATVNTTWVNPAGAALDKATGATIDETMTDGWSSDLYHLGGANGYIGCRTSHVATQSIANATITALAVATESFDSDPNGAMHDPVTNNSRVVARTTGVYHVTGHAQFASNATGYRYLGLRVNGASVYATTCVPAASSIETELSVTTSASLAATDYLELIAAQASGGALNVNICTLTVVKA